MARELEGIMAKVSIIIPSRDEISLAGDGKTVLFKTVENVLENATGDIEVLVGFDGPPYQPLPNDPRVKGIQVSEARGVKPMINTLAGASIGKYVFKLDGHCSVGKGFDEILQADMQDNWLMMPRFYVLNENTWNWQDERFYDYFYLSCPFTDPRGVRFKAGGHWPQRTQEKLDVLIDETPQFHGSGWMVERDFFLNKIGGFPVIDPLGHAQEPPHLGFKYYLGPWKGAVMVNKKTWYAHMHKKPHHYTNFKMSNAQNKISYDVAVEYWLKNKWPERIHDLEWFVEKFMPMPTWPENWKELWENYLVKNKE